MIKIMVISRTPWNVSNSFGNTFSNLFEGMEDVEIYNICCQSGSADNDIVKCSVQLTDKSVLNSFLKKKQDPCCEQKVPQAEDNNEKGNISKKNLPKNTFNYMARDFIWKLGKWKNSETLNKFLNSVKPNLIYLPIYASWYMCDFQYWIIDKLNVPVVGHISDDVYGYPKGSTPLELLYRFSLRKKVKKLVEKCSYLEVFAENMKTEYEKIFDKKCYLIGKGIDISETDLSRVEKISLLDKPIKFLYTGNIGCERYKVICDIAKAIDKCSSDCEAVLEVYSANAPTNRMKKEFAKCKSLKFGGKITFNEVKKKQFDADILIHVESFSKRGLSSAKMSFSTKIIDYMLAKKPILAVGPEVVNSISLLKNREIAITVTSREDIDKEIENILHGQYDLSNIVNQALKYLKEERDIKKIQSGILSRLENVVKNENSSDKCSI